MGIQPGDHGYPGKRCSQNGPAAGRLFPDEFVQCSADQDFPTNGVASAATSVIVTVLKGWTVRCRTLCVAVVAQLAADTGCVLLIPAIAWVMRTFSSRLRNASRGAQVSTSNMVQVLQSPRTAIA